MKKIILFVVLLVVAVVSGCPGPHYGSIRNYDSGNWWGWSSQDEALDYKSQQLAFKKMEASDVKGDSVQGYEGIVSNESRSKININIVGPEKRSFFMEGGGKKYVRLVPGKYVANFFKAEKLVYSEAFTVGPRENMYKDENVAWFVIWVP